MVSSCSMLMLAILCSSVVFQGLVGLAAADDGAAISSAPSISECVVLEDFSRPRHEWRLMLDPVMGGQSTGSFTIEDRNDEGTSQVVAHLLGTVAVVPFLHAPGFLKVETTVPPSASSSTSATWPDVSACRAIRVTGRSRVPYDGFRFSFGRARPPHAFRYIYGYKANLTLPSNDTTPYPTSFSIDVPFDEFTDNWDPETGNANITCQQNHDYCPDEKTLREDLYSMAVWAEGVQGDVDLDLYNIQACECALQRDENYTQYNDFDQQQQKEREKLGSSNNETMKSSSPDQSSDTITLEDFANPLHIWTTLSDPVMGGKSSSSLRIEDGVAKFTGTCAIVPSLQAPGFITMVTGGFRQAPEFFPDVSSCEALQLEVRSLVDYKGYYLSFGKDRAPGGRYAMGYKSPLHVPVSLSTDSGDFSWITIPFGNFSDKWDDKTGKTIVECRDDTRYCPTIESLRNLETISIWGEGVEGQIDLEIKSIQAVGCASSVSFHISTLSALAPQKNNHLSFFRASSLLFMTVGIGFWVRHTCATAGRRGHDYEEIKPVDWDRQFEMA